MVRFQPLSRVVGSLSNGPDRSHMGLANYITNWDDPPSTRKQPSTTDMSFLAQEVEGHDVPISKAGIWQNSSKRA